MTVTGRDIAARDEVRPTTPPFLALSEVVKHFQVHRGLLASVGLVHAVDNVSLEVAEGETLGVVGESGCGKSTLARIIVGLHEPTSGTVELEGVNIHERTSQAKAARRKLQMVFQDPTGSLSPRMTLGESIAEPLRAMGVRHTDEQVRSILELVSLDTEYASRLPHQVSGGQQQRACIARALIAEARVVVHDEAVSALDVSLQAQVLNLLRDLQQRLHLTYVFISHDLATVQSISSRIAVMYLGEVVELATAVDFHRQPLHPYSISLRSAVPVPNPKVERSRRRIILRGDVPSPLNPPQGCRFHTRCPVAQPICGEVVPPFVEHQPGHFAACHFAGDFGPTLARTAHPADTGGNA
ncbi:MAG: ABC transporter ATP-binding protein [Actinomycetota bacterium]|nr:ABC transporter ATP-binding protein [Actinomycetota bacterium]